MKTKIILETEKNKRIPGIVEDNVKIIGKEEVSEIEFGLITVFYFYSLREPLGIKSKYIKKIEMYYEE